MKARNFISVEGIDGSGKTLAVDTICERLTKNGYAVVRTLDPAGTDLGVHVRPKMVSGTLSKHAEMLLYLAARIELVEKVIRPALEGECVVVSDRFFDSTFAYQGYGRGLKDFVLKTEALGTSDIQPGHTVLMRVDAKTSNERVASRKGIEPDAFDLASDLFKTSVIAGYDARSQEDPERFFVVDATRTIPEVVDLINSWVDQNYPFKLQGK